MPYNSVAEHVGREQWKRKPLYLEMDIKLGSAIFERLNCLHLENFMVFESLLTPKSQFCCWIRFIFIVMICPARPDGHFLCTSLVQSGRTSHCYSHFIGGHVEAERGERHMPPPGQRSVVLLLVTVHKPSLFHG